MLYENNNELPEHCQECDFYKETSQGKGYCTSTEKTNFEQCDTYKFG
jgi:hypothetical protein